MNKDNLNTVAYYQWYSSMINDMKSIPSLKEFKNDYNKQRLVCFDIIQMAEHLNRMSIDSKNK